MSHPVYKVSEKGQDTWISWKV